MDKNKKEATPDLSAFLASAVHDMKNSIGILINFLETNLTELGPDAQEKAAPMLYEVKRGQGQMDPHKNLGRSLIVLSTIKKQPRLLFCVYCLSLMPGLFAQLLDRA
ncbi:MAG: hypothetical protein PHG89_02200 [Gallionella sp.]|nr:hypothetical protein [Gallionella sp.]